MPDAAAATMTETRPETPTKQPWLWNVVILDDDQHTYEYVIKMVQSLFHHPLEKAFAIAREVDKAGRSVAYTTHRELAELKREQALAFGADKLIASCKGPMTVLLEPCWGEGDSADNAGRSGDRSDAER